MDALKPLLHGALTPLLAVATFLAGFYALLGAMTRVDWPIVVGAALLAIGGAIAAFGVRKTRPNLALVFALLPGVLLAAVLLLR